MGLFKSKAPKPPDYSKIAAAQQKSAQLSFDIAKEQLTWAKQQYASDMEVAKPIIEAATARMKQNDEWATADRARYEDTFRPLEDQLIADAASYADGSRQDMEAGRAQANTAQALDKARDASRQQLESYGINPSSLRYGALDAGMRANQAAAVAASGNEARRDADNTGRALRSEALGIGRGLPGQAMAASGQAGGQGSGAVSGQLGTTSSGASTMGTGAQWNAAGNSALGQWGSTIAQGYQDQLSRFNANANQSSGIGALAGTALGAYMAFEDGGLVPDHSSPSGGAITDDVPAALNAGEFVIPEDVVRWEGEKSLQNLIKKARMAIEAPKEAEPEMALRVPQEPAFRSSALPA